MDGGSRKVPRTPRVRVDTTSVIAQRSRLDPGSVPPSAAALFRALQQGAGNRATAELAQRHRLDRSAAGAGSLPTGLKSGIEALTGMSMDDVSVHRDSVKPSLLGARAYARDREIHLAPGESRHLPHEAWHVVQQAQGRVQPMRRSGGAWVNDDAGLEREADAMGRRALAVTSNGGDLSHPQTAAAPRSPSDAVAQLVRTAIPAVGSADAVTLADLDSAVPLIDAEIAELDAAHPEVTGSYVDLARITTWRAQLTARLAALRALDPLGVAAPSFDDIKGAATPLLQAFKSAVVSISNLRKALNDSLSDYQRVTDNTAIMEAETRARLGIETAKAAAREPRRPDAPSPYAAQVKKYVKELEGAVVLVEGHYVVSVEHYQLKHNANLGPLKPGGPFLGKKGSAMPGGWKEHETTYAPQVLALAKAEIAKFKGTVDENTELKPGKLRTADLEAYLVITRKGNDWIIAYHCNPPGG